MIRSKAKSKQVRPQSAKCEILLQKRTWQIKNNQIILDSQLRPLSQDYHTSLNHNLMDKNNFMMRNNQSGQKRNNKAGKSTNVHSSKFLTKNNQIEQGFHSKQKSRQKQQKLKKDNNQRKQTNLSTKQKQGKQSFRIKTGNKQKQRPLKQAKTKCLTYKGFIGSKLRKNLENYLLFVNLINYSIRIKYKSPETRRYNVYVGKGNNSKLVRKLFSSRFWWNVQTKNQSGKDINLVWSQWSKPNVFDQIPKVGRAQECQMSVVQQDMQALNSRAKLCKAKQHFLKKLTIQSGNNIEHIYDLFQQNDKKQLFRRASKKDLKYQDLKDLVSKQSKKTFKKINVCLSHNHIQNHQQITNKKNLFFNLKEQQKENIFQIVPLTFHVSNLQEGQKQTQNSLNTILNSIEQYMDRRQDKTPLWIVKPGQNSNRGCGIQVFRKAQHIKTHVLKQKQKHPQRTFIVQKYLNPFLYHRRKFDLRCYLLVTATPGVRAYYYPVGYIRTSSHQFTTKNCSNKFVHLTNDAVQKKQQQYGKYEKGNKVTYQEFQKYLDLFQSKKQLDFQKQIVPKMQEAMLRTVKAVTSSTKQDRESARKVLNPQSRIHSFELYGFDFMIDDNFLPWLIEVNTNPCIETGCQILQDIIPTLLQNVIKICVDTVFPPPKLQDWPLNQILTCSQKIFQTNLFQLIYSELQA